MYPKLNPPFLQGGFWHIQGDYDLLDNIGVLHETFRIEIIIPPDYPNKPPFLYERSNKIPVELDWHNTPFGCCLSPEVVVFNRLGQIDLMRWFKIFVESFFANYIYKRKYNEYPSGEYEHGIQGIIDGYKKVFSLSTDQEVISLLGNLLNPPKQCRNEKCYCLSGNKFKHCGLVNSQSHQHQYRIPIELMKHDLSMISSIPPSP